MNTLRALQASSLALYLRTVRATCAVRIDGEPAESALMPVWHESLLVGAAVAAGRPNVAVYVLEHLVTPWILHTLEELELALIRARPENSFGYRAVQDWTAKKGHHVLITLDGPEGPLRKCQTGVARLARMAAVPLCPVHLTASRGFERDTWDRCLVPEPFGRLTATCRPLIEAAGSPRRIAAEVDAELLRASRDHPVTPPAVSIAPLRLWARMCFAPLTFGSLRIGPAPRSVD